MDIFIPPNKYETNFYNCFVGRNQIQIQQTNKYSMRKRADWMVPADDKILEYLEVAGEVRPATIGRNVNITRDYAGLRVRKLSEYGLVESLDSSYYKLSSEGELYLSGEIDASGLER